MRRRCRHHGRARGMRADAERDAVGLPVNHAAAPVIDAERVGGDLRHDGLKALAERGAAGDDLDHARRIDRYVHAVGRAEPAFLDEHRDADADQLARGLALFHVGIEPVPADLGEQLVEQPDIVAAVVMDFLAQSFERPRVGHFRGADGVAPPHLDAIDAEVLRRWHRPSARARRWSRSGRVRDRLPPASCWSGGNGRPRDKPARDRAPARCRRSCARRAPHGCAHKRPDRGNSDRRWQE